MRLRFNNGNDYLSKAGPLGISVFDKEKDNSFHDIFERADQLMYERKMQLKEMGAKTREQQIII